VKWEAACISIGLKHTVIETMRKNGALAQIGQDNLFPMGIQVIDKLYPRFDSDICRRCTTRIFSQCDIALPNGEPRTQAEGAAAAKSATTVETSRTVG
jgi:SulP family sulfate permease